MKLTKYILIVEDQVIVRKGLKMIIESDSSLSVIAEAGNGIEAINALEKHVIDLVLLDIRMPEMNGVEVTKIIKKRWPTVKVLILTTFNDDEYAMQTLKDGANGFMLKTAEPKKLISAVHSVLTGGMVLHEEVAAKVMPKLLQHKGVEFQDIRLTERELEIAKLVGEGMTNKEISEVLYLSVGTVKNHLTNILHTLELRDRTQLAIFAVKNGWI